MADLSVIIPCHNAETTADHLLASLDRNRFDGLEIILVDDASTDLTPCKLISFASSRSFASVITHDHPRGVSAARNTGLARASGRYVTFLDADDWIAPGYLRSLLIEIRRLDVPFVRVDHVATSGRVRRIVRVPEVRRDRSLAPARSIVPAATRTSVDYPYCWAGIYDTHRLPADVLRFDESLRTAEDRPWIWRLYLSAECHSVTGLAGVFHRDWRPGSLTRRGDDSQLDFLPAMRAVVELATGTGDDEIVCKAVSTLAVLIARQLRLSGRLSADDRRMLIRRSAAELARVPTHQFDAAMDVIGWRRAALVRALRWYGARCACSGAPVVSS